MRAPCVRVPVEAGEAARQALLEADLLVHDLEIDVEDGWLYLPVRDADATATLAGDGGLDASAEESDRPVQTTERDFEPRETQTLPADLLEEAPSYERVGDIAVLHEDDPERARAIADAILASDLSVTTVVNRASAVRGTERVRDWDVLADERDDDESSRPSTETVHREYGVELAVDLASVYFSPRLATERQRVVEQVEPGERAFDMFAGAGPFAVRLAAAGAEVVAVDVNPEAVDYLEANAERNGVADRVTAIEADVRDVTDEYAGWADRVVMNLPHSAEDFLDAAVTVAGDDCVVHYYDIQPEDDPYAAGEAAIREAAESAYGVTVEDRREVRSYAPGMVNVCLDVRLTRRA